MRRRTASTLQDIANEVGVHVMAVSVVLNGARSTARVSDTTRDRILEAAERLHYRPNAVAQGLLRGRMNVLGVVATIDGQELNLYVLEVLNGILEDATKYGQSTMVCSVPNWTQGEAAIHSFCDGRVDGIIFIAPRVPADFFRSLHARVPIVTIHHAGAGPEVYNLDSDGECGAYRAVHYLAGLGHRRILHITGEESLYVTRQRLAGYRRGLAEYGIPYDRELVLYGNLSTQSAQRITRELLETRRIDPMPTAIFGGNDAIAIGCMEVLAEYGVRVPEDMSVVGFDDILAARTTVPTLTTVGQPLRLLGQRAVDVLLNKIDMPHESDANQIAELFDANLIVRGSTGPPPC